MSTILIIEDNPELRDEISEPLSLEGYEVLIARDGYDGLRKARITLPDLILCDIMLPDISGYEEMLLMLISGSQFVK